VRKATVFSVCSAAAQRVTTSPNVALAKTRVELNFFMVFVSLSENLVFSKMRPLIATAYQTALISRITLSALELPGEF
jgi:hypothetical protein